MTFIKQQCKMNISRYCSFHMADIQYENTKESNVSVVGSPTHMISILVKEK